MKRPFYIIYFYFIISCKVDPAIPQECDIVENDFTTIVEPENKYFREFPVSNPNNPNEFAYIKSNPDIEIEIRKFNLSNNEDEIIIKFNSWEHPDWSVKNWLVFGTGGQIYKCKSNGDSLTQLTFSGANYAPSWSADGTKIIFWGHYGLAQTYYYTIDEYGNGFAILDSTLFGARPASFSPDGLKLAFVHEDDQKSDAVAYINLNDPKTLNVIGSTMTEGSNVNGFLDWSLDSKSIIYSNQDQSLFKVNLETAEIDVIKDNCQFKYQSHTLLADGETIISERNHYLFYEDINTLYHYFDLVQISPDGSELIIPY